MMRRLLYALACTALAAFPVTTRAHHAKDFSALQEKVAALDALKPSFAEFMPNFAERFHVLHAAGDAGDWPVAGHEFAVLRKEVGAAKYLDTENGKLFGAMLTPAFTEIEHAIEKGDTKKFKAAMEQTITSCNACHTAVGSGFIKVTLSTRHVLSMRHSHTLSARAPSEGHHHHGDEAEGEHHEEGMAMPMMSVERNDFKKTISTMMASSAPYPMLDETKSIDSHI